MHKDRLITAALRQIPFEGWTKAAFSKAEAAEGFSAGTYAAYFPGGVQDFIRCFWHFIDAAMEAELAGQRDFEQAKVREKIYRCVMARLHAMAPYREAVRRLIGHQLLPWNKPLALGNLGRAADAMWRAAGDRSIDYNYYTKRLLLAGVYTATLRKWLGDQGQDETAVQDFLRARIEQVLKFGKTVQSIKAYFGKKAA